MNGYEKRAFTLFELLVVIGVMVIIAAGGFLTFGSGGDARKLDRGADMLQSMLRVARTQALTNGAHARLIVHNDPSEPEHYLRKIGVMVEDEADDYWRAVERGALLPEGVYVVPQGGSVLFPDGWPEGGKSVYKVTNTSALDSATFKFAYPWLDPVPEEQVHDQARLWIAFQFAPNGRLSTANWGGGGGPVPSNLRLVLANGNWQGGAVRFRRSEGIKAYAFKLTGATFLLPGSEVVDDS